MKYAKIFFVLLALTLFVSCTKKEEKQAVTAVENTVKGKFGTPMNFTSKDLDGNVIGSDAFKNADVTLVNIWATWCGPCRGELPALGKVAEKYRAKGYQVFGFIQDVSDVTDESAPVAKEILANARCTFPVVMNTSAMEPIFSDINAFPMTLFIDRDGNMILDEHIGAMDEAGFEAMFEKAIAAVNAKK